MLNTWMLEFRIARFFLNIMFFLRSNTTKKITTFDKILITHYDE